jgi:hypothetical protein
MDNISVCLKCPLKSPPPYTGVCLCTISGRDIVDHALKGDCPKGYYSAPDAMPAQKRTADAVASAVVEGDCGCSRRRKAATDAAALQSPGATAGGTAL